MSCGYLWFSNVIAVPSIGSAQELCFCSLHRCGLLKKLESMHNIWRCRTSAFNRSGGGGRLVQAKGVEAVLVWVADSNVLKGTWA